MGTLFAIIAGLFIYNGYLGKQLEENEIQSQVLKGRIQETIKLAEGYSAKAAEADKQVVILVENVKQERKKNARIQSDLNTLLSNYKPDPIPDDKDQIIEKQGELITGLTEENVMLQQALDTTTIARDLCRQEAVQYKEAFVLSEQRVRTEQLAKEAMKAAGPMREAKGILEGGAVVFLAHVLGVF